MLPPPIVPRLEGKSQYKKRNPRPILNVSGSGRLPWLVLRLVLDGRGGSRRVCARSLRSLPPGTFSRMMSMGKGKKDRLVAQSLGSCVVKRGMALMGFTVLVHRWIFRTIASDLSCTSLCWLRRFLFCFVFLLYSRILFVFSFPTCSCEVIGSCCIQVKIPVISWPLFHCKAVCNAKSWKEQLEFLFLVE